MKSLSRRKGDDEGGRKPAKDGPGFQVDGPRAWGWHLSVAGVKERGQAGMSAKRSAARAGGGRGELRTGTSGEPEVREYVADDLGGLDRREQAHAAATARAGEHVEGEAAPHQVGPRPATGLAGSVATELEDLRHGGVGDGVCSRDPRALRGDGAAAPAGLGREAPGVAHASDAGPRGEGRELFEEGVAGRPVAC